MNEEIIMDWETKMLYLQKDDSPNYTSNSGKSGLLSCTLPRTTLFTTRNTSLVINFRRETKKKR